MQRGNAVMFRARPAALSGFAALAGVNAKSTGRRRRDSGGVATVRNAVKGPARPRWRILQTVRIREWGHPIVA